MQLSLDEGKSTRVPVAFVLGQRPIEQFLGTMQGGRLQALPWAFDTVRSEWFDLNGGRELQAEDWEHWSNRGTTANTECLYCHTTGYKKGYEAGNDRFASTWQEAGVGCEACHGPGAAHEADPGGGGYAMPRAAEDPMAVCGACHARRVELGEGFRPSDQFLDFFDPTLLDEAAFFADGQVADEDFEWASFRSSRMFDEGVSCKDCHDAHSGLLLHEGNRLCLSCHEPRFDLVEHTRHRVGAGTQCVSCHMPETTYMQRDPRRDHSMTMPDPAATISFGIPNACNGCHAKEGPGWAQSHVATWYTGKRLRERHAVTELMQRAKQGSADTTSLVELIRSERNAVRRASLLRLLPQTLPSQAFDALAQAANDSNPLLRASAIWLLAAPSRPTSATLPILLQASRDPVRLVRLRAAWGLRSVALTGAAEIDRTATERATTEWLEWHRRHLSDSVQGNYNLGIFLAARGDGDGAIRAYRAALQLRPKELWPRQNLAVLLGQTGHRTEAESEFLTIAADHPDWPGAPFSLALFYGENERWDEAAGMLERTVAIDPAYPRALYNLGLAYAKQSRISIALDTLEKAALVEDSRADAIRALVSLSKQAGDSERTLRWLVEGTKSGIFEATKHHIGEPPSKP